MSAPTWFDDQAAAARAHARGAVERVTAAVGFGPGEIDGRLVDDLEVRVAGFVRCWHLRRAAGPRSAVAALALERVDCGRCSQTERTEPAGLCGLCRTGGHAERFGLVVQVGDVVVVGDVCSVCAGHETEG